MFWKVVSKLNENIDEGKKKQKKEKWIKWSSQVKEGKKKVKHGPGKRIYITIFISSYQEEKQSKKNIKKEQQGLDSYDPWTHKNIIFTHHGSKHETILQHIAGIMVNNGVKIRLCGHNHNDKQTKT